MNHHGAEKEFITAFWQIYEHKPLEKISIKELCIKAGITGLPFMYIIKIFMICWTKLWTICFLL